MTSRRVVLGAAFALALSGTAACDIADDDPNEDGHFYCADANGVVVDEEYCDDSSSNYDSSMFFFYMGSSMHGGNSYSHGSRLPAGAQKFSVTDRASRTKFGLPASGRVNNGTVKTGVIGKGGPGSTAKVGGGSGGKYGGSGGKSGGG